MAQAQHDAHSCIAVTEFSAERSPLLLSPFFTTYLLPVLSPLLENWHRDSEQGPACSQLCLMESRCESTGSGEVKIRDQRGHPFIEQGPTSKSWG